MSSATRHDDGDWETVRNGRRGHRAHSAPVLSKLKEMPIPVVPLGIRALAVEETDAERAQREKDKATKKAAAKRRKARKAAEDVQVEADTEADDAEADTVAASPTLQKAPTISAQQARNLASGSHEKLTASSAKQLDNVKSWLAPLFLFWAWLQQLLGLKSSGKQRSKRSKTNKQKLVDAIAVTADVTAPTSSESQPASTVADQREVVMSNATSAPAAKKTTAALSQPHQLLLAAAPPTSESMHKQQLQASAAPGTSPVTASATALASNACVARPASASALPASGSGNAANDPIWQRGHFSASHVPTAHPDVLSAVALAGDLALSTGYDGAVKVWSWPRSTGGTPILPRCVKSLTGHSGRVEALAADAASSRAVSCGRDSLLKVWSLDASGGGRGSKEAASYYVFESVKCLDVDWATGVVGLGSRAGTAQLYDLQTGRKLQTLKAAHDDELTVIRQYGGGSRLLTGGRDALVKIWDLSQAPGKHQAVAVLTGVRGRVASLELLPDQQTLLVGDTSTSLKLFDLRKLPPQSPPLGTGSSTLRPVAHIPNAPVFAGGACPVAGLAANPKAGILLSSSLAWWTNNTQVLEESPEGPDAQPMACLNIHAMGGSSAATTQAQHLAVQYMYTVRLTPGVVTCMATDWSRNRILVGSSTGALSAVTLQSGEGNAEGIDRGEAVVGLDVGVEEHSDDESDGEFDAAAE